LELFLEHSEKIQPKKELKEIQNEIGSEKVDIGKLKSLYRSNKLRTPQDQDKEMRDAFKALDKEGNGKVLEAELRQILGNLGDSLSNQEVNSLMRDANVESDGCVDYNKFVDMLVNAFPVGDKLKG